MKPSIYRILAASIVAACALANLVAQTPDWYTTHKNLRYPAEMYIIGVGAGTGSNATELAKKAAQTDLVSQIRVQVQAQVKNISESYQFNKDEQLFSDFRSNVRTAVNDEVAGMEVIETTTDKAAGTAYALVVLERDKYCGSLKNEMDAGWKQAEELRASSSGYAKQGKLADALQSLLDARISMTPLLTKQTLYNAVSNTAYQPPVNLGPSTIALDQGPKSARSSSARSPSRSTVLAVARSVVRSMCSRSSVPSGVNAPSATRPRSVRRS